MNTKTKGKSSAWLIVLTWIFILAGFGVAAGFAVDAVKKGGQKSSVAGALNSAPKTCRACQTDPEAVRIYVVKQGDTLWNLARARFGDSHQWKQIVAANPLLEEDGRLYFKNGKAHVRIYPGDVLLGF